MRRTTFITAAVLLLAGCATDSNRTARDFASELPAGWTAPNGSTGQAPAFWWHNFRDARLSEAIGHALDANGFYWFEDPVPVSDVESIRELTRRLDTPLNMSDTSEFLLHEAANFLQLGAVRLIRGTVRKIGITGLKKQMSLVEGFNRVCEIGLAGNSALNAANLHVMMSSLNCTYFEYWLPKTVHQWGVISQLEINENGNLDAPTGPGLGIELDEDWIASHRVATLS